MGVLVREDPYLLEAIFNNAVTVGEKFVCTKVNEQLIRIALNVPLQGLRLSDLVKKYLGEDISETKGLDGWRMRYHLLDGVPVSDWPDEALKYAGLDAEYALLVLQQQRKHYGQYLADAPSQVEASWALHLMRNWGMRVDPDSVYALTKSIVKQVRESDETGTRLGIVRPNGTRDMGALRGLVKRAYRYIGKIPTTPKGAVSTSGETLLASRDPDLISFAQGAPARKLLTTYVPLLERGIGVPINAFFNVLVRSGRTSCFKPNLQNLPRQHGVREAFIPRPNMTFCTVDYDTIELRALAQVHLNWFGQSALAEAFIEGEDPHLSLAAHILDIS
jgi:DNA polymerase I-like protein with 3'-5' exonuclease and polymerase domains